MDNKQLMEVQTYTNLGLTLTSNMQWNTHIDKAITKESKRLYYLRRLQYILPRSALESIYLTMIRQILEYGDVIYDNCPLYMSLKLEYVQRRAALICTGAYRHTEHSVLLLELGWELLSTRRYYRRLQIYYTLVHGPTPNHIKPHMPSTVSTTSSYNLRNKNDNRTPLTRLTSTHNSFFPRTTRDWNKLPVHTRASLTKQSFKRAIKPKLVKNVYASTHYGKCGAWISRIRMGLRRLNAHRFKYNFIDSPTCPKCKLGDETTLHFLWDCPAYMSDRKHMIDEINALTGTDRANRASIISIIIDGKIEKDLHETLFQITSDFLAATGRFN
jgi:hypothetical protein